MHPKKSDAGMARYYFDLLDEDVLVIDDEGLAGSARRSS